MSKKNHFTRTQHTRGNAGYVKRALSAVLSATLVLTAVNPVNVAAAQNTDTAAKVVRLEPAKASSFHDTDGDGLGEFEGFGTSLCWWANRIGYNDELTQKAGELFFNAEKGLGMSIGRYNLGGGDLVGEVTVPQVQPNPKAVMYDLETEGYMPSYAGSNMSINVVNFGETTFTASDADFGFLKGNAVGSFKYIGWINKLTDTAGSGDKLTFTVNAPQEGDYTVKLLLTLTGTNSRDVALRVMNTSENVAQVNVLNEEAITEEETTEEITETETETVEETEAEEETSTVEESSEEEETEVSTVIYLEKNFAENTVAAKTLSSETEEEYTDYVVDSAKINANQIANDGSNKLFVATIENVKLKKGDNTVLVAGQKDWTLDFIKMAVIKAGDEASVDDMKKNEEEQETELPEFLHSEHIIRSDSAVPGYCTDVTRMDLTKKSLAEYEKEYDRVDETSGFAWNYDWDADKNQMNVLKTAIKNGGSDFLAEIFSNSPPYFMTESGCSSGNTNANKDNLRADCYEAFAKYMADVIEYWHENGIDFQSATPMNEPYTNYWGARSNKQEGCHFDIGDSQSKILVTLKKELEEKGLDDILISASDETSIDTAITSYNKLSDDAKNVVERIDTHTYGGSKRSELKSLALSENKNLWMSEVDGSFTGGTNAGQMSAALGLGQRMIDDVNGLGASAWILWNAIDMHVDSSEYGASYVEKGSNNDYLTKERMYASWIPKETSGYWGIAAANHDTNEIYLTKKYYAFGQFSRYIRPGYTIIGSSDDSKVMTAYDPKDDKVVVVAMNTTDADETWQFDLSMFNKMDKKATVTAIRTSGSLEDGENWADVSKNDDIVINTEEKTVSATMKANSITTYTITGVTYDPENPVADKLTAVSVSKDSVWGSSPWSGSKNCDVDKVIDGDFSTYFDGVTNGYVIADLGEETELSAIAYAPRSGYTDRCVGAMLAGSNDGKNWTKLYTITEKPSAGALTYVYASQFAGDSNKFRYVKYYVEGSGTNCNVAELKFFTSEPAVATLNPVTVLTEPGKIPTLPEKVEGKTVSGESKDFAVTWKIDESVFADTKLLDKVLVSGKVAEINLETEATVLVMPEKTEYLVDCNLSDSENFNIAKENLQGLLNKVSDQKKTAANTWGYLEQYGEYNDSSSSGSGWYAYSNQDIKYVFQLPAGSHDLTLCASGKWWNSSRNMQISYVVDGKETNICTLQTEKGEEVTAAGKIDLKKDAQVTVCVKKAEGESQDPVLSWIGIVADTSATPDSKEEDKKTSSGSDDSSSSNSTSNESSSESSSSSTVETTSNSSTSQKQDTSSEVTDIVADETAKADTPVLTPALRKTTKQNTTVKTQNKENDSLDAADTKEKTLTEEKVTEAEAVETSTEQLEDAKQETVIDDAAIPTTAAPAKQKTPIAAAAAAVAIAIVACGGVIVTRKYRGQRK